MAESNVMDMADRTVSDMAQRNVIDAVTYRQVLSHYPTGVSVITSADADGSPAAGMVVGTFTSVSIDPPLVAFLPDKNSTSWPLIAETGRFCVNVLSTEQETLCRKFSARGGDKFDGVAWHRSPSGMPVLDGVITWVDCRIEQIVESGDHYIVVGRVLDLAVTSDALPLTFHRGTFGQVAPMDPHTNDDEARQLELQRLAAQIFRPGRATEFADEVGALARLYADGYSHLPESRSELIVTILTEYLEHLVAAYSRSVAGATGATGGFTALVRATLEVNRDHRAAAVLYQNERQSLVDVDTTHLRQFERQMQASWVAMIERGQRDGVFQHEADSTLTYFLVRDALFLAARWFRPEGRLSLDDVQRQAESLFLKGLAVQAPRA
ncbi:flavin reductase [Georgenia yuyongxinii]|uniref:flavin reductase n=1 Tax=Georgenia yuyongxinii TaxID=2589797 RepID=UPI00163DA2DD|nr:flavin reductase [Georgenia yuyongxinii]